MTDKVYAGFWIRFWASIIDSVLLTMLLAPLLPLLIGDAADNPLSVLNFLSSTAICLVATVVFWIYRSATPGKMILGLSIVDAKTGGKPSSGQLLIRYLGYYVSAIPFFVGFIVVATDARKQGWHDRIAGTLVLQKSRASGATNNKPDA